MRSWTWALAAGLATGGAPCATAGAPRDVTITTVVSYVPTESFAWSATGAIVDGGALEFLDAHWGAALSPAVGALRLEMRLHGAVGTIDLVANLLATATDTTGAIAFDGPFVVTGGTGAYAGARGTGTAHVDGRVDQQSTPDDPEVGVLPGRIRLD
jgi:hypothetical protein